MDISTVFGIAGLIIFIGFVGELIFRRTNIPDVIWLMIVGIMLKIFIEELVGNIAFGSIAPFFTTFALIFILFEGAINININQFIKGLLPGVNLTLLSFLFSSLSVSIVMSLFFGWPFLSALLLGTIIGGSSSAIVIPIIRGLSISKKANLMLTIESAISDVLCIVTSITILNIITLNELAVDSVFQDILYSFVVAAFLGMIFGILWIRLHEYMDKFSRSYMTTIAFMLLVYAMVEFVGSNGAIACLVFGLLMGNSKKILAAFNQKTIQILNPAARFFYSEISFFVKSFFFVYLGILIDFSDYFALIIGFMLTVILVLIRPAAVHIAAGNKMRKKDRTFMEILAPKGLAAAVLAQLPMQAGIENGPRYSTIVSSVIFFSILVSTILVFLTDKGYFKGVSIPKVNFPKVEESWQKGLHDYLDRRRNPK